MTDTPYVARARTAPGERWHIIPASRPLTGQTPALCGADVDAGDATPADLLTPNIGLCPECDAAWWASR